MKILLILTVVMLLVSACGPGIQAVSTSTMVPTAASTMTPAETHTPSATDVKISTPTPVVEPEIVSFLTEDDLTIAGSLFGEGEIAVILTHMGEAGSDSRASWVPFARHVAAGGQVTALAIDLRGYGSSSGPRRTNRQSLDVLGAVKFLQERGFNQIVCMGASMGGSACVEAALAYPDLVGLAVIASDPRLDRDYSPLTMPKLFVLEGGDPYNLTGRMEAVYEMMPDPKEFHTFPENVHGTRMFDTPSGDEIRQLLVDFLESFVE